MMTILFNAHLNLTKEYLYNTQWLDLSGLSVYRIHEMFASKMYY